MGLDAKNLTSVERHATEEKADRIAGDAAASLVCCYIRAYVPRGTTLLVPSKHQIIVSRQYEIEEDGILELALDASLEVL